MEPAQLLGSKRTKRSCRKRRPFFAALDDMGMPRGIPIILAVILLSFGDWTIDHAYEGIYVILSEATTPPESGAKDQPTWEWVVKIGFGLRTDHPLTTLHVMHGIFVSKSYEN